MQQYPTTDESSLFKSNTGGVDPKKVQLMKLYLKVMFDHWNGLLGKHKLAILPINPAVELQGQFMGAFGGFLSREFMAGDFIHGMDRASTELKKYVADLTAGASNQKVDNLFERAAELRSLAVTWVGDADVEGRVRENLGYYVPRPGHVARSIDDVNPELLEQIKETGIASGLGTAGKMFPNVVDKAGGGVQMFLSGFKVAGIALAGLAVWAIGWVVAGVLGYGGMAPFYVLGGTLILVVFSLVLAYGWISKKLTPSLHERVQKVLAMLRA